MKGRLQRFSVSIHENETNTLLIRHAGVCNNGVRQKARIGPHRNRWVRSGLNISWETVAIQEGNRR